MENLFITLYDSDEAYVRKLAFVLQNFLDSDVMIRTKIQNTGERAGDCVTIRLVRGEEESKEITLWEEEIYKFQPVSRIAGRIRSQFPEKEKRGSCVRKTGRQQWYGVVSPCRHESAVPFVCTLAAELGEKKRVLVVLFTQFCGITQLLEPDSGCDVEGFYLELRRCSTESAAGVSLPQTISLPGFELLPEPGNPEVLYELREQDLRRLTLSLTNSPYDAVVWLAENVFQGFEHLIAQSRCVFSLEKTDTGSICRQKEFDAFGMKLMGEEWREKIRRLTLPVFEQMECGQHLLWQWRESELCTEVRKWTEEESEHGN